MMDLTHKETMANGKRAMLLSRSRLALCFVSIVGINWFSNYLQFQYFGLYIDDYFRIPRLMVAMREGVPEILATIFSSSYNVRPIHGGLIYTLSFIGLNLGGISGIYFIGFLILSINALLCFILINAVMRNALTSFIGALAFVLYAATTVKIWITAALGIQPALTLVLLAFILHLRQRKLSAYLLVTISLFCYETAYWVFIAAPLLLFSWERNLLKKIVVHGIILALIFAVFFAFKTICSDPRLQNNCITTLMSMSIKHLVEGPFFNLLGQLKILVKTAIGMNGKGLIVGVISTMVVFLIMLMIGTQKINRDTIVGPSNRNPMVNAKASIMKGNGDNFKLLAIGAVMLFSAYPLSFLGDVRTIYNIGSRLHLAASIGIAFLYAGVGAIFVNFSDCLKKGAAGRLLLSVVVSIMVLNGLQVQQDYRDAERIQTQYWRDLINLCPDFREGMLIFFDPQNAKRVSSISAFCWSTSLVLENLFDFPIDWKSKPRVYVVNKPGLERLLSSSNDLTLSDLQKMDFINLVIPADAGRKIEIENSVFVYYKGNTLTRLTGGENIETTHQLHKTNDKILKDFSKGVLYQLLMQGS